MIQETKNDIYQIVKIAGGILFLSWLVPQIIQIEKLLIMILEELD